MIVGLRGRRAFGVLRREGRRARGANLEVQCRPEAGGDLRRVAFAVNRQVGSAVVRNRVRRRLRAALQELDRLDDPRFPPGDYLVRVRPGAGELGFDTLRADLHRSLARMGVQR